MQICSDDNSCCLSTEDLFDDFCKHESSEEENQEEFDGNESDIEDENESETSGAEITCDSNLPCTKAKRGKQDRKGSEGR